MDTPGFQNPRTAQQQRGGTFEELCHNYVQERLQTLFHERTFVREMERYKEVPPAHARLVPIRGIPFALCLQGRNGIRLEPPPPDPPNPICNDS